MTNTNRIPNGTKVTLADGTAALAYNDADGTYRTTQRNLATGGNRVDFGWRREQLTIVGYALEVKTAQNGRLSWVGVIR